MIVVCPDLIEFKSGRLRHGGKTFRRMLVGKFRDDLFPGLETESMIVHLNGLSALAYQVHFNAPCHRVVNSPVFPRSYVKVRVKFAVGTS